MDSVWKLFSHALLQKDTALLRALSLREVSCMTATKSLPATHVKVAIDTFLKRLLFTKADSKFFSLIKGLYDYLPFDNVNSGSLSSEKGLTGFCIPFTEDLYEPPLLSLSILSKVPTGNFIFRVMQVPPDNRETKACL
jgi:hypothetical protein